MNTIVTVLATIAFLCSIVVFLWMFLIANYLNKRINDQANLILKTSQSVSSQSDLILEISKHLQETDKLFKSLGGVN